MVEVAGDDRFLDVIDARFVQALGRHALELVVDAAGEHVQPFGFARLDARDHVRAKAALGVLAQTLGEHRAARMRSNSCMATVVVPMSTAMP